MLRHRGWLGVLGLALLSPPVGVAQALSFADDKASIKSTSSLPFADAALAKGTNWPAWIPGFDLGNGCNGPVNTFAHDAALDVVYVGGNFTTCGESGANNVARFDLASRSWSALAGADDGNGVGGPVLSLLVVDDQVYVGGNFDRVNVGAPVLASSVARWDGDAWHALPGSGGQGVDGFVYAMAWFDDSLHVGGWFSTANVGASVDARSIARWDGTAWSALSPSAPGPNGTVTTLAVHAGALYVGGEFGFIESPDIAHDGIARWDGDAWSTVGNSIPSDGFSPIAFAIHQDRLVASRGGLWSLDGNQWKPLAVSGDWEGTESGPPLVHAGQLIATFGSLRRFDTASGAWIDSLGPAIWNGSTWLPFDSALSAFLGGTAGVLASCGMTLCVERSTSIASQPADASRGSLATWQAGMVSPMGAGAGNGARSTIAATLVVGSDVYVGGDFTVIGDVSANGIARWDGRRWSALGNAAGNGLRASVKALATYDGDLYAAGVFHGANGSSSTGIEAIMRWDGSSWSAVGEPPLIGGLAEIRTMVEWRDELYVGGIFGNSAGPFADLTVLRWNGNQWNNLPNNALAFGRVNALAVLDDQLYVAGVLALSAAGVPQAANRIARWDGNNWHALQSATGEGVNQEVYSLLADGTDLYVGGVFTAANVGNPIAAPGLARWDGMTWHAVGSAQPAMLIRSIARSGNALYVGAARATAGQNADRAVLARWDGSVWTTVGLEVAGRSVNSIAYYPEVSGIVLGGDFGSTGGVASSNIAMFGTDPRVFVDGFELEVLLSD